MVGIVIIIFFVICSHGNFWMLYDLAENYCVEASWFFLGGIFELLSCLVLSSLDNVSDWLSLVLDMILDIVGQFLIDCEFDM